MDRDDAWHRLDHGGRVRCVMQSNLPMQRSPAPKSVPVMVIFQLLWALGPLSFIASGD